MDESLYILYLGGTIGLNSVSLKCFNIGTPKNH